MMVFNWHLNNSTSWLFRNFHPAFKKVQGSHRRICAMVFISKNAELQSFGQTCKTVYFIKSASARIFYCKDGNGITEYFAFENNFIARAESLFAGSPFRKAIQVLEDTEIIAINAQYFSSYTMPILKLNDFFVSYSSRPMPKRYIEWRVFSFTPQGRDILCCSIIPIW